MLILNRTPIYRCGRNLISTFFEHFGSFDFLTWNSYISRLFLNLAKMEHRVLKSLIFYHHFLRFFLYCPRLLRGVKFFWFFNATFYNGTLGRHMGLFKIFVRKWILVVNYAFCGPNWIFNNRKLFGFNFGHHGGMHGRFFEFSWFGTAHLWHLGHFGHFWRASLWVVRIPPNFLIMVQERLRAPLNSLGQPERIKLFFLFKFNYHVVING